MINDNRPHVPRRDPNLDGKRFILGVGAMKAGTSWLNSYLNESPDVVCSPLKEVHFFDTKFDLKGELNSQRAVERVLGLMNRDDKFLERLETRPYYQASIDRLRMIYDDRAYFDHFSRLSRPEAKNFCEVTPRYGILPREGFEYVKHVFADQGLSLKLVFLLRDPVERHWSHLRFAQSRNSTFDPIGQFDEHLENPNILERSDYRMTIENLTAVFPANKIYFEFYERIFSENAMRRLCEFLEIGYHDFDFDEKKNETSIQAVLKEERQAAIFHKLRGIYEYCADYFGDRLPAEWRSKMAQFQ